jgi:hypothetical protein
VDIIGGMKMDENGKAVYPEINFTYMVFQSWNDKGYIFYYLDGNQSRRTLNIPSFLQMIQDKFPTLMHDAHEACKSASFHLLDANEKTITHLFPSANEEPYLDSIQQIMNDKRAGKRTKTLIGEKKSMNEILNQYGFNAPSKDNIDNMRVTLEKKDEREGLLARFMGRYTKPR